MFTDIYQSSTHITKLYYIALSNSDPQFHLVEPVQPSTVEKTQQQQVTIPIFKWKKFPLECSKYSISLYVDGYSLHRKNTSGNKEAEEGINSIVNYLLCVYPHSAGKRKVNGLSSTNESPYYLDFGMCKSDSVPTDICSPKSVTRFNREFRQLIHWRQLSAIENGSVVVCDFTTPLEEGGWETNAIYEKLNFKNIFLISIGERIPKKLSDNSDLILHDDKHSFVRYMAERKGKTISGEGVNALEINSRRLMALDNSDGSSMLIKILMVD